MIGTIYDMKSWLTMSIRVGTLVIPVGLVSQQASPRSRMKKIHTACKTPVETRAWCEHHQKILGPEEVQVAFEVAAGQLIPLTHDEIKELSPTDNRELRITSVVDRRHTAAVQASYWLTPVSDYAVGRRPYVLLARVLHATDLVALTRATVKASEWVCGIRAEGNVLVLDRLVLADDHVAADPIIDDVKTVDVADEEMQLGTELVMGLFRKNGPRPGELSSPHRERVTELIDRKLAGENIITPAAAAPAAEPTQLPTSDLASVLRESIRDVRRRPTTKKPGARSSRRPRARA